MTKLLSLIEPYKLYIIAILAGIALFFLWDFAIEIILGLFGLGGAVAAKKQSAKRAKAQADEHVQMMDHAIDQAVIAQKKTDEKREEINRIAEDITPLPEPKPGTVRKKFEIR